MTVEETIYRHFAEQVSIEFNRIRFGLESCKVDKDHLYMNDLLELYVNAKEMQDCTESFDTCPNCDLDAVIEVIQTL